MWSLQLFPGGFWIEISPDVFLKGTVGEGRCLFSVEHRRYFLYPHPKGVPYPSMPWNLHGRSIVAHKTGTSQTINLMLSTIHLVIKSAKQKVAGSCTSAATKSSIHFLLYFHSKNSHQEISECIHLLVFLVQASYNSCLMFLVIFENSSLISSVSNSVIKSSHSSPVKKALFGFVSLV